MLDSRPIVLTVGDLVSVEPETRPGVRLSEGGIGYVRSVNNDDD
jgi:hypothetical protein